MRATTLYSVGSTQTRDHEAIIRFYGEASRRWAHSRYGINTMAVFGSPPPRIVIGSLSAGAETGCLIVLPTRGSGSHCPQRDTCRDFPSRNHAPQGDEEFSRQRHDHGRLPLPGGALSPCIIPLGQGALLLEAQEPPRQLHEAGLEHCPPLPNPSRGV